jgi:hypothetical protein
MQLTIRACIVTNLSGVPAHECCVAHANVIPFVDKVTRGVAIVRLRCKLNHSKHYIPAACSTYVCTVIHVQCQRWNGMECELRCESCFFDSFEALDGQVHGRPAPTTKRLIGHGAIATNIEVGTGDV